MEKLVRRIATAVASLAVAGGALLATGGSAAAATLPADAPAPARAGLVAETGTDGWNHGRYVGDRGDGYRYHWRASYVYVLVRYPYDDRFYPWVSDQLDTFGYVN